MRTSSILCKLFVFQVKLDDFDDDAFDSENSDVTRESWQNDVITSQIMKREHNNSKTSQAANSDCDVTGVVSQQKERAPKVVVGDEVNGRKLVAEEEVPNDLSKPTSLVRKKATAAPRHRRRSDNRSSQSDDVTSTERRTTKRKRQHNHRSRHDRTSRASSDRSRRRHLPTSDPHNPRTPANLTPPPLPFNCDSEGRSRSPQVSPFQKVKEWMLAPNVTPEPPDDIDLNLELKNLATKRSDVTRDVKIKKEVEESAA